MNLLLKISFKFLFLMLLKNIMQKKNLLLFTLIIKKIFLFILIIWLVYVIVEKIIVILFNAIIWEI